MSLRCILIGKPGRPPPPPPMRKRDPKRKAWSNIFPRPKQTPQPAQQKRQHTKMNSAFRGWPGLLKTQRLFGSEALNLQSLQHTPLHPPRCNREPLLLICYTSDLSLSACQVAIACDSMCACVGGSPPEKGVPVFLVPRRPASRSAQPYASVTPNSS